MAGDPVAPRRLRAGLPLDLETICLKALAKEPGRRYASAQELADDLGRFERGEPIQAKPRGFVGRAWRWCRRNRRVAALSATLVIALAAGIGGILWQSWRAQDNANRADELRLLAEKRGDEAEASLREACEAVDQFFSRVCSCTSPRNQVVSIAWLTLA